MKDDAELRAKSRDRAERIGQVAEHLILVYSEQIKWVAEMEGQGEDTSFACGVLAKRAAKNGRMKKAYRFLEKTREFIKKGTTEAVFQEELEDITLKATDERTLFRFGVYLPAPGARERVE